MAERINDEYQLINFYKKHSRAKSAGFSKFEFDGAFYFCRFVDGDIALISQDYTSAAGRDNGIASVRKNEKLKARYNFETRPNDKYGFALKAGNSQEIAISPDYANAGRAEHIVGRLNGSVKAKVSKAVKPKRRKQGHQKIRAKQLMRRMAEPMIIKNWLFIKNMAARRRMDLIASRRAGSIISRCVKAAILF